MIEAMEELPRVFKALSDRNRLKIFILLCQRTLCVNALVDCFGISQSAVSQHLRVLREAGLVSAEKRGYWMHYSADKNKAEQFIKKFNSLLGGETYVRKDEQKRLRTPGKVKGKT